jgi:hypothetical protein
LVKALIARPPTKKNRAANDKVEPEILLAVEFYGGL